MTTNQTIDGVPRDDIELFLVYGTLTEESRAAGDRLRALLDTERCTSCDGSGDLTDLTGEWRGYCVCPDGIALKNKPATQPQGEPVALFESVIGKDPQAFLTEPVYQVTESEVIEFARLLSAAPAPVAPTPINYGALDPVERLAVCRGEVAPVAVVMPERRADIDSDKPELLMAVASWNACLDELKRLNPSL